MRKMIIRSEQARSKNNKNNNTRSCYLSAKTRPSQIGMEE